MGTTPDAAATRALARPRRVEMVAAPVAPDAGYGGLVTRVFAAAIDAAILNVVVLSVAAVVTLVLSIFPVASDTKKLLEAAGGVLVATWTVAYFVVFWSTTGQTPGDRVMRIRVVRVDAGQLRPARALLRLAGAILGLILFLGYVPILFTAHRRALHDWMAGTVVIVSKPTPTEGTIS
jgi:uncharacterized RDD family membrane protein YckC